MSTFRRTPPLKRPAPLSIRLTPEERQRLEQLAGSMSLAAYLKLAALEGQRASRAHSRTRADQQMLARVLAALGTSQLAASLERLSYAAKNGTLYVDDTLAAKFAAACDDVRAMHLHLLEALGKRLPATPPPDQRLGIKFAHAALDMKPRP